MNRLLTRAKLQIGEWRWNLWRRHWVYWENRHHYGYQTIWDKNSPKGEWRIYRGSQFSHKVVFRFPYRDEHDRLGQPPQEVRAEYERLIKYVPPPPKSAADVIDDSAVNVVEIVAQGEDCAFDQPCIYGHRVETHAVYCHNDAWLYAPRKCKYTTGPSAWGDKPWPHENCPGFLANPKYKPPASGASRSSR